MKLTCIIKQKQEKTSKNKQKENKENRVKTITEMCMKSIQSGVCPHACDICAWNILRYAESEEEK